MFLPALLLTACPDKDAGLALPGEEVTPAPVEEPSTGEPAPRSVVEAKESVCDCTCESEGCKCSPLTWRVGCSCIDRDMKDCTCDCKGEPIVTVDEVTAEASVKTPPDLRIEAPSNEEIAEQVPPPPPPPPDQP